MELVSSCSQSLLSKIIQLKQKNSKEFGLKNWENDSVLELWAGWPFVTSAVFIGYKSWGPSHGWDAAVVSMVGMATTPEGTQSSCTQARTVTTGTSSWASACQDADLTAIKTTHAPMSLCPADSKHPLFLRKLLKDQKFQQLFCQLEP